LSNLANRQTDRQTPAIAFTSSVVGGKLCATLRCIGTRVYVAGRRLSFHDPLSRMVTRSTSGCRVAGSNSDGGYRPNFVMFYLVFMLYCIIVICQLLCPRPVGGGGGIKRCSASVVRLSVCPSVCLMSRTSALTQKPKGLGRRNFAQGYPRSHATPTPTSRSKGQKSRWGLGILWRRLIRTACSV